MIKADNIVFAYKNRNIFNNFSMHINQGEFICIQGENGSGKSTLLKLCAGLLKPYRGNILIDGLDISKPDNLANIRHIMGYISQNPQNKIVFADIFDEIAFFPSLKGYSTEKIMQNVNYYIDLFDLKYLENIDTYNLSGGEAAKVALASVLSADIKVLILDEVSAPFDNKSSKQILDILKDFQKRYSLTILLATHRPGDLKYADRAINL